MHNVIKLPIDVQSKRTLQVFYSNELCFIVFFILFIPRCSVFGFGGRDYSHQELPLISFTWILTNCIFFKANNVLKDSFDNFMWDKFRPPIRVGILQILMLEI